MEHPAHQPAENLPATKSDLRTLLREELKPINETLDKHTELLKKQGGAIVDLQTNVGKIKETMATKAHVDELLAVAESIVPKGQMYSQKAETHAHMLQDHEEKLKKHDKRIADLEIKS